MSSRGQCLFKRSRVELLAVRCESFELLSGSVEGRVLGSARAFQLELVLELNEFLPDLLHDVFALGDLSLDLSLNALEFAISTRELLEAVLLHLLVEYDTVFIGLVFV